MTTHEAAMLGIDNDQPEVGTMSGRSYTIDLDEVEAVTVARMAAESDRTPEEIVQHLVRTSLFRTAVSLATGEWTWRDLVTGIVGPDPEMTEQHWNQIRDALLYGPKDGSGVQ